MPLDRRLSSFMKKRKREKNQKFQFWFNTSAKMFNWLFSTAKSLLLIFNVLVLSHILTFMPLICIFSVNGGKTLKGSRLRVAIISSHRSSRV